MDHDNQTPPVLPPSPTAAAVAAATTTAASAPEPARAPGRSAGWPLASFSRTLLVALTANTMIAALFAVVTPWSLVDTFVQSHAIGLSIFGSSWVLHRLPWSRGKHWLAPAIAIPLGGALGIVVGQLWQARGLNHDFFANPRMLSGSLAGTIIFGVAASLYFHTRAEMAQARARLQDEELRRVENEQRLTAAELKLLQAQIEPHFLFNTLSNVLQLVDANPPGAKRMLLNLTSYLRASLQRTRSGATTLGEELDLVNAYCEIQAVRMGPRLTFRVECPAALRGVALPPLLLQPLVENAVRHGLEPQPAGGDVCVRIAQAGDILHLEVIDTGLGLKAGSAPGIGLANVHDRVRAISHGRGTMVTKPNSPSGMCVHIELPLSAAPLAAGRP